MSDHNRNNPYKRAIATTGCCGVVHDGNCWKGRWLQAPTERELHRYYSGTTPTNPSRIWSSSHHISSSFWELQKQTTPLFYVILGRVACGTGIIRLLESRTCKDSSQIHHHQINKQSTFSSILAFLPLMPTPVSLTSFTGTSK